LAPSLENPLTKSPGTLGMAVSGIQVIEPEITLTTEMEEAIIDKFSDGSTDTLGLNVSVVRFPRGVRRPWSPHTQD
jgi:hypothetical protein